ncbi:rhodanese-like domain-containing protein [Bacillus sp. 31A1R]|uniref:Rhodanese-like domain-containing protein n=1 Tax=Robertmurraya mangrovi TaxID=3098077 RepID=A0ABU5J2P7_9BACI|nr:rhodanese-like domain-containing protein [Bacillus sp. 31A1R]MDZ5473688.1 rhodanese-like domain-containing protein [Bacillus sp. 31A1R]
MTIRKVSPKDLFARLQKEEKVFLLDVRAEEKYNEFHIEDLHLEALNIPKNRIFDAEEKGETIDFIPKERNFIVTCTTGNSAAKCAAILNNKEFDVAVLEGGLTAWKEFLKTLEN